MDQDLKFIKKHYGEKMMHLCREMFPQILETEALLPKILEEHFVFNRTLAKDIEEHQLQGDFRNYIFSFIDVGNEKKDILPNKTAIELLEEAGYVLFPECKTEEDVQKFRHYYHRTDGKIVKYKGGKPERYQGEELCTFNGGRLNICRIWFAVKKNVDELKRKDFRDPTRQDEYGTSVISIQFTRNKSSNLSIKNRYNHVVKNPDNTFNSDLDNIILGLTEAFHKDYGVKDTNKRSSRFELDGYVNVNGKFYKYNNEINNIYYCPNNVIIDNFNVKKLPDHQILVDYFVFDIKNKTVSLYDKKIRDSFVDGLKNIQDISLKNNTIILKIKDAEDICIGINDSRQMISLVDSSIKNCDKNFLNENKSLVKLDLPNLTKCGFCFLYRNNNLTQLSLPNLKECGDDFLRSNKRLTVLSLPNLTKCGYGFLRNNNSLTNLSLPNLTKCNWRFLYSNNSLKTLSLPNLIKCGDEFLYCNNSLTDLDLPKLIKRGRGFLYNNKTLKMSMSPDLTRSLSVNI